MPDSERLYLDTNIFIRLNEGEGSERALLETVLVTGAVRSTAGFATSELTRSELLVKPYRDGKISLAETYDAIFAGAKWLDVQAVSAEVLDLAAVLRAKHSGLKLPDAIHLATAIWGRCTIFLTADLGLFSIKAIDHPLKGPLGIQPVKVLHPDEPTLTSLIESLAR